MRLGGERVAYSDAEIPVGGVGVVGEDAEGAGACLLGAGGCSLPRRVGG